MRIFAQRWCMLARMLFRVVCQGLLVLSVGIAGCKRRATPALATQAPLALAARSSVDHDAAAVAEAAADGGASRVAHCKAIEPHGTVTLAAVKVEDAARLFAQNGAVYLFSYHQSLARVRLTKISRDGSETRVIASHQGLGAPSHFQLTRAAAYFSRHGSVIRMGLEDGVVSEVATGLSPAFAVHADRVYGTVRGRRGANDQLVVVERPGSPPTPIVEIPAALSVRDNGFKESRRDYDYRDVSVDDKDAFVSDWDARRIIAVSLGDRTVRNIVGNRAFLLVRRLEAQAVVFSAASGLYRVTRSGGAPTRLSEIGKAPETVSFDSDESDFWMYQTEHFSDVHGIYRVPRTGGTTTPFAAFPPYTANDPLHEDGFRDLAVDDECLYFARRVNTGTDKLSILAQPKN